MTDDKKEVDPKLDAEEEKNIDDLLKEYADDVKDRDLDDFLKHPSDAEEDDDAFESDDDDDDDNVMVADAPKRSGGGFLSFLTILIIFGAAGAGAWWFMNNKDGGMTPMMSGISSSNDKNMMADNALGTPPSPDSAPVLPPLSDDVQDGDFSSMPPMPEIPTPGDATDMAIMETSDTPPALDQYNTGDFFAVPVADNVDVAMPPLETEEPKKPETSEAPEEKNVSTDVSEAVDTWAAGEASLDAEEMPAQEVKEVKAKPVSTPKKQEKMDEALSPPFVAMKAKKGMAPVVNEGRAARGSTASTEPAVTRATGIYRDLVAKGGGRLDLPGLNTNTIPAPVGMMPTRPVQTQTRPSTLAIDGGKSVPAGTKVIVRQVRDAAPEFTAPAEPEPQVIAAPVETVEQVMPAQNRMLETVSTLSDSETDARTILNAAMAAERSGATGDALELYQRALEVDAVYGDGASIDRGLVYDRIGAIRNGS